MVRGDRSIPCSAAALSLQAIRLSDCIVKRRDRPMATYIGTSAKMAPVWADREGGSCGLNTNKQVSGCNDETLCLFCNIGLAS
ncbi:hypothetical protein F5B18DRAFT_603121 [Nemania serpens]|nr:hypothetical protein F5B18DRAFT_603121 [Nemania serpens]